MSGETPGTLGRYRLVRRLGRGDATEAFEARIEGAAGISKRLCIKRVLPRFARSRRFVSVLARQTRAAMGLQHGNIAQILDLAREGDEIFLATELVDGESVFRLIRRMSRRGLQLPDEVAVHIVMEVCRALDYAHRFSNQGSKACGIVHGDVSPKSILISREGQVKLTDFGMGSAFRAVDHHAAMMERMLYAPPGEGEHLSHWTDVHGAGAVLFHLLAGRPPYDAASILSAGPGSNPPSLEEAAPWVEPEVCEIVDRALSPDDEERLPDARAMEEMLAAHLHGRSMVAEEDLAALLRDESEEEHAGGSGSGRYQPAPRPSRAAAREAGGRRRTAVAAASGLVVLIAAVSLLFTFGPAPTVSAREVEVRSQPASKMVSARLES
ncbi:MAG: serine/threonine-protein kinase, partial [Myxococcota bacterium]